MARAANLLILLSAFIQSGFSVDSGFVPLKEYGKMEVVLRIGRGKLDSMFASTGTHMAEEFFVGRDGPSSVACLLEAKDSDKRYRRWLAVDGRGNILSRSGWQDMSEFGDNARFRTFGGSTYYGGIGRFALRVKNGTFERTPNPWDTASVNRKYARTLLPFGRGWGGELVPLFRASKSAVLFISGDSLFRRDIDRKAEFLRVVPPITMGRDLDTGEALYFEDPIVGLFDEVIVLWGHWELSFSSLKTGSPYLVDISTLAEIGGLGRVKSEAESLRASWFADDSTFYLLIETSRGLFVLRYSAVDH
jgi:hypothetical protein